MAPVMAELAVAVVARAVQQELAVAAADHLLVFIFSIMVQVQILYNQVF
jgi:hypothetical protein